MYLPPPAVSLCPHACGGAPLRSGLCCARGQPKRRRSPGTPSSPQRWESAGLTTRLLSPAAPARCAPCRRPVTGSSRCRAAGARRGAVLPAGRRGCGSVRSSGRGVCEIRAWRCAEMSDRGKSYRKLRAGRCREAGASSRRCPHPAAPSPLSLGTARLVPAQPHSSAGLGPGGCCGRAHLLGCMRGSLLLERLRVAVTALPP